MCVQLISSRQIKHIKIYLWCLSTLRTWEGLELEYQSLKLPLHAIPNTWFVHEISQSRYGNPYNLPLWLFRDKTTTHINSSQKINLWVNDDFLQYKEIYKNKSWSLQSLVDQSIPESKVSILSNSSKKWDNQVRIKTSICILRNLSTTNNIMQCLMNAMLPLKGLLPLNVLSPQHAQLLPQPHGIGVIGISLD